MNTLDDLIPNVNDILTIEDQKRLNRMLDRPIAELHMKKLFGFIPQFYTTYKPIRDSYHKELVISSFLKIFSYKSTAHSHQ